MTKLTINILFIFLSIFIYSQEEERYNWLSLGGRSTVSSFSHDGAGIGTGGQFRIELSERVNTDWFADYISINTDGKVRSEYYHIGWSVLFYPFKEMIFPKKIQPYILAGHCFDYNKKTVIKKPSISKDRWGSAVQTGIGTHFNVSKRFDVSLTMQYMIHLTNELEITEVNAPHPHSNSIQITEHSQSSMEGHLLSTLSLNYKIVKLWARK